MIFNETTIVGGNQSINNVSSQWRNVLRDKLRRLVSFGRRTAFERDVCGRIQLGSLLNELLLHLEQIKVR